MSNVMYNSERWELRIDHKVSNMAFKRAVSLAKSQRFVSVRKNGRRRIGKQN